MAFQYCACFTNSRNIPLLQRFPLYFFILFFFICVHQPTARTTRLIFQNMFLASDPLPSLSPPTPPASSLTHEALSLFTTYSPISTPDTSPHFPNPLPLSIPHLPACSPKCVMFFPLSRALLLHCSLQSVRQDSMFYGLIRNDPGRSSQAAEAPKAGG